MTVEDRITLDTNILVYAVDLDAGEKNETARSLMGAAARKDSYLTVQALGEFFHATTRKKLLGTEEAERFIEEWRSVFSIIVASEAALMTATKAVREHGISFWDAMLWATVRQAGCTHILSEDMQHGRNLGGVEIINPFDEGAADVLTNLLGSKLNQPVDR